MSTPQLSPGTVIDGRFTVGNATRAREGATVYEASDAQGSTASVTVYGASCFPSGLVLERSLRELRQLKSVASPRVARLIEVGKLDGGGIYEVTDTLPQQTLAEALANGPLPLKDAASLAVQVGEALLEAQRVGVMHRNLGADVVFPSPEGIRVTGFAVGEPQAEKSFGPLHTIAPEQVAGKVVDQRTLVYNVAALMHWMLSGGPLFTGDRETVLAAVTAGDLPAGVDEKLHRALGKDARMRPMMLKQFLGEVAVMGNVAPPRISDRIATPNVSAPKVAPKVAPKAPAASKPSSRGWTMFMQAQDDEPAKAPAAAPAAEGKPSTRGWTMFMNEDGENASGDAGEVQPAAAPAQAAPEADPAKPSTRGWTMFMEAQADGEGGDAKPAQEEEAGPAPAAAPPADPAKPSTRGWTMFMNEDGEAAKSEDAAAATEAAPAAAEPAAPAAAAPAADPAKPSTRGWTMFMEDEGEGGGEAAEPNADAVAAPAADAPTTPTQTPPPGAAPADGAAGPPSSRGWTMFMEPGGSPGNPAEGTAGAPPAAAPPAAAPVAAAPPAAEVEAPQTAGPGAADGGAEKKKRGWTMFMDAPIAELAKKPAEAEAEPPQKPAAAPPTADRKGWTVFGEPSPLAGKSPEEIKGIAEAAASAAAEVDENRKTLMVTKDAGASAPREAAQAPVPNPAGASASTVVTGGPPSSSTSSPGTSTRGNTVISTSAPAAPQPDTMYFKRGESEPEAGRPRASTVRDVPAPAAGAPIEERDGRSGDNLPSIPAPSAVQAQGGGSKAPLIIGAVVAVSALAAGAYFLFT